MKTKQNNHISHEIQIHYKRPLYNSLQKIGSSEDAESILRNFVDPNRIDHKEFFWIILLSNSNHVLGISEIGAGCSNSVHINIKEICQLALLTNANALVIAHNHPSGNLKPSESDHKITSQLKELLDRMDIHLLDHIILTSEGHTSFKDNEWM